MRHDLSKAQEQALNALLTAFLNQGAIIGLDYRKADGSLALDRKGRLEFSRAIKEPGLGCRYDFAVSRQVHYSEFGKGRRSFCIDRLLAVRHQGCEVRLRDVRAA